MEMYLKKLETECTHLVSAVDWTCSCSPSLQHPNTSNKQPFNLQKMDRYISPLNTFPQQYQAIAQDQIYTMFFFIPVYVSFMFTLRHIPYRLLCKDLYCPR